VRTKGCLSHATAMPMVFKLVTAASRTWRRLSGTNQLPKVVYGEIQGRHRGEQGRRNHRRDRRRLIRPSPKLGHSPKPLGFPQIDVV